MSRAEQIPDRGAGPPDAAVNCYLIVAAEVATGLIFIWFSSSHYLFLIRSQVTCVWLNRLLPLLINIEYGP